MESIQEYARMLHVIFEDNHLLVVKKPIGVPSQKDISNDPDMVSIVKEYIRVKYAKPGNVFVGNVHRLDRMVGGLMVFAKTSKSATRLSQIIITPEFEKRYYAVVNGVIDKMSSQSKVESFLSKDEQTRMSKIDQTKGKYSSLQYSSLGTFSFGMKRYSLLDIALETGRYHQIRVQMASIGHPLYGDQKYGSKENIVGEVLGLWAYSVCFEHPVTHVQMRFKLSPEHVGIWKKVYETGLLKN
jgi:23S rRNA pseudouridine1911/1915/1917 synthase